MPAQNLSTESLTYPVQLFLFRTPPEPLISLACMGELGGLSSWIDRLCRVRQRWVMRSGNMVLLISLSVRALDFPQVGNLPSPEKTEQSAAS